MPHQKSFSSSEEDIREYEGRENITLFCSPFESFYLSQLNKKHSVNQQSIFTIFLTGKDVYVHLYILFINSLFIST